MTIRHTLDTTVPAVKLPETYELFIETNKRLGEIRNELRDLNCLFGDFFAEYVALRPELKKMLEKMQKGILG